MRHGKAASHEMVFIIFMLSISIFSCQSNGVDIPNTSIQEINEAKERALQIDNRVNIVWAAGRRKDFGAMKNPTKTEVFSSIAVAYNPNGPDFGSWEIIHQDGNWEEIALDDTPMGIRVDIDLSNVSMDVCEAWDLTLGNKYPEYFYNWELLQGLHPEINNPYYAFRTNTGFIIVDTVTSIVRFEVK